VAWIGVRKTIPSPLLGLVSAGGAAHHLHGG